VRLPRVVAGLTLIVALALVALPAAVGSRTPSADSAIDPALFERVDRALALRDTAATAYSLDPAITSAATLDPHSAVVETSSGVSTERPSVALPRAVRRSVATPAVGFVAAGPVTTTGGTGASSSGWRRDPEVSWYGPGFYGNRTACGKTLTTTLLGVANKTLPCGTMVSFRNPSNGRVVTVPVVDRGPYVAGRQWDLTAGACKAIAHCYTGPIQWRFG
jgi:rare lipoprotein A (peptidoglycan hydrolase)